MSYTKVVVDCLSGEEQYIPFTAEEIANMEARQAESIAKAAEQETALAAETAARESARAKLAALGLTEAEVAALVK
jgi:hypothetical protein